MKGRVDMENLIIVKEPYKRGKHIFPNVKTAVEHYYMSKDVIVWAFNNDIIVSQENFFELTRDFIGSVTAEIEKGLKRDKIAYWNGLAFKY